jgi:Kef-type K+ transport system membrane component KefB
VIFLPFSSSTKYLLLLFLCIHTTDKVIVFIFVAWLLGTLSIYIGLPSLVGEIMAGFLLGPPLADFVPFPGALVLTGNLGLIGLILESGIALDVDQLKENAGKALLLAIVGSILPLLSGFGIGRWIGMDVKSAIAVGAAFAPSSLGVASNALSSGDVLNTPIGQTIVASSVFDDVFGLILLSILQVFADPDPPIFHYILPFIASFGYLIILGLLGVTIFPRFIQNRILPLVAEGKRDEFAVVLMMGLMVVYMVALNYSGASFLTGVFLAGLTFSQLHTVHAFFVKHGRPFLNWLLRIFFAATIGFQVPVTRFQDLYVLKWGICLCKQRDESIFRACQILMS